MDGVDVRIFGFLGSVGGDEDVVDGLASEGLASAFEHATFESLDIGVKHVQVLDALLLHKVVDADDRRAIHHALRFLHRQYVTSDKFFARLATKLEKFKLGGSKL